MKLYPGKTMKTVTDPDRISYFQCFAEGIGNPQSLAEAEAWARDNGILFFWDRDTISSDSADEWVCYAKKEDQIIASRFAINFGDDIEFSEPSEHPFTTVIEALLALKAWANFPLRYKPSSLQAKTHQPDHED